MAINAAAIHLIVMFVEAAASWLLLSPNLTNLFSFNSDKLFLHELCAGWVLGYVFSEVFLLLVEVTDVAFFKYAGAAALAAIGCAAVAFSRGLHHSVNNDDTNSVPTVLRNYIKFACVLGILAAAVGIAVEPKVGLVVGLTVYMVGRSMLCFHYFYHTLVHTTSWKAKLAMVGCLLFFVGIFLPNGMPITWFQIPLVVYHLYDIKQKHCKGDAKQMVGVPNSSV